MSKNYIKQTRKKPWIPPPGRTTQKNKLTQKPVEAALEMLHQSKAPIRDEDSDLTFTLSSIASSLPAGDVYHFHSMFPALIQELRLLRLHCVSLKTSSQYLHRAFDVSQPQDQVTKELIAKIDHYVLDFNKSIDELECSMALIENNGNFTGNLEEFLNLNKSKEYLLSRLLETYENVIAILQVALESQKHSNMTGVCTEQETLKNKLKTVSQKAASQEAIITEQGRRITILQGKVNAMESYRMSLESSKDSLRQQMVYKESQIKYLSEELSKTNIAGEGKSDNEALIEIIEELKSNAKLEKEALKKAVKAQKTRAKAAEESATETKRELQEKVKQLYEIASERDQWKVELTVARNSLIEFKNQIEELKKQNLKRQSQLTDLESGGKDEATKFEENLQQLKDENEKLKGKNEELIQKLDLCASELKQIKEKYEETKEIKNATLLPSEEQSKLDETLKEMKNLGTLLQSTREILNSTKMLPASHKDWSSGDNTHKGTQENNMQNNIVHMVQETKEYLLEIKNLYNLFLETHQKTSDPMDKKFHELEDLYSQVVQDNKKLQEEIDFMKNNLSKSTQVKASNHYERVNTFSNVDSTKKLWSDFQNKNEEFEILQKSYLEKEKEHVSEILLLREKITREETQFEMKLTRLEDELRMKKMELSSMEQLKKEEEDRLQKKIRALQDSLDQTTASYESLQKYVQILKSSYLNVFGSS